MHKFCTENGYKASMPFSSTIPDSVVPDSPLWVQAAYYHLSEAVTHHSSLYEEMKYWGSGFHPVLLPYFHGYLKSKVQQTLRNEILIIV